MRHVLIITLATLVLILTLIRPHQPIPKIMWTHWNSSNLPDNIALIWKKRQETLPGWRHIMVHDDTVEQFTGPLPERQLSHQHRADWIRLQLLRKYGGVWADSSIIFNSAAAVDALHAAASMSDLGVFDMFKSDGAYLENWFIAAPPQSPLICAWFDEFNHAINIGFLAYKDRLFREGIKIHEKIYKKDNDQVYLTQHAALQAAIQRYPGIPRLVTWPAEDSMFSIQVACNWDHECIVRRLEDPSIKNKYPYIKLRGGDREFDVERYFATAFAV